MTAELIGNTCYLYVLDTLADWEIAHITAELYSGRFLDKTNGDFTITKIGNTLQPVITMGGMQITPDQAITGTGFKKGDLLILPGGDTWLEEKNRQIIQMVPALLEKGVIVAAICGATVALAGAGILNDKKHTSNNKEFLVSSCPGYAGADLYVDVPAVVDGNLITATGLAALEFSYEVFKKTGAMKEAALEAWYGLYKTREPQYFYALMESLK